MVLCVVIGGLTACEPKVPDTLHYTGSTMGTYYSIKVTRGSLTVGGEGARSVDTKQVGTEQLRSDIERILAHINHTMSTYLADSELSRFNASTNTDWFPVSQDLYTVVQEALTISRLTDGAFDITVGPLVNLWGFGPSPKSEKSENSGKSEGGGQQLMQQSIPSDTDLGAAMARIGYQKLAIRATPPALRKDQPQLYLDLSAIAKGFAVDKVAEYLEENGFMNYLVDIGGELRAKGKSAKNKPWRVAIEEPVSGGRGIHRVIKVDDQAVATSGDYRNFFERDGKRYSHTIDPKTGRPITHNLVSVTVLDSRTMRADALATGLSVLGPEAGYEFAKRENIPVWLITKTETGFQDRSTSGFAEFLIDE